MLVRRLITLAAFSCAAFLLRKTPTYNNDKQRQEETGKAKNHNPYAEHGRPNRPNVPPSASDVGSDEREHRLKEQGHWSKEERYWTRQISFSIATSVAALAAAGAAVFALYFSWRTVYEAHEQAVAARASYLASNRAWFDVNVDLTSLSLKWKEGVGATLYSQVEGINNGNSPAIEATVNGVMSVDRGGFKSWPRDVVNNTCVEWSPVNGGDMVFMKEPIESSNPAYVPWSDIMESFHHQPGDNAIQPQSKQDNSALLYFVVCAMYKVIGDDAWHHTARIFKVVRLDKSDGSAASVYLKLGEDLEAGSLTLIREDIGAYAD